MPTAPSATHPHLNDDEDGGGDEDDDDEDDEDVGGGDDNLDIDHISPTIPTSPFATHFRILILALMVIKTILMFIFTSDFWHFSLPKTTVVPCRWHWTEEGSQ